jgi:hypothetical protein
MTNVTPIGSKLLPESWEGNLFCAIIASFHGLYSTFLKDFNRASETHNLAHNLLRKSESVLVDPCGLALSLAVLLSIQEIPADLDSPVVIVREFFEIHRQCDYRRAGNFTQIRSLFSDLQLRSLVKDIPKVVLRRGVIRFVRRYARIAVSYLAKEFDLRDYEAEPVICQPKDSRKFHETSMKAI